MGFSVPVSVSPKEEDGFEIMAGNRESILAFLAVETQWRVASSMAGIFYLGLDYSAVDVVLRRHGFPDSVFADLQLIEHVALPVLNGG